MQILIVALVILGIGFLIAIHELGHFIMAKRARVRVEIFSIGFGPAIFRFRRPGDETEYRVSWIPLGGYVKLAGELPTPERKPEPHELWAKTPWQKFTIFVAGAAMNLIIAFPLCMVAYKVGRHLSLPYVGQTVGPEAEAGIRQGDRILSVGGVPVRSLDDYRFEILNQTYGNAIPVKVERGDRTLEFAVVARGSKYHQIAAPRNMIQSVQPEKEAARKGLRDGDELLAISWDSERVEVFDEVGYLEALKKAGHRPLTFHARRGSEMVQASFEMPKRSGKEFPFDEHLIEAVIGKVGEGHPAYGKLQENDRILKIDGEEIRSWAGLKAAILPKAGREIKIEFERAGERKSDVIAIGTNEKGQGRLGVSPVSTGVVADVGKDSFWDKAGLKPGDRLIMVGDKHGEVKVMDLFVAEDVSSIARSRQSVKVPDTLRVRVQRNGKIEDVNPPVAPREVVVANDEELGFVLMESAATIPYTWGESVEAGLKGPIRITELTFGLLYKLFAGQEPASGLAGPVGIFHASYVMLERGLGNFIWLLALISVNLGIINLLPLPLLDGGHMWILLAYEKIKRRPPSERFLAVFQYAGLAFFLLMVIFVTFNDVFRIWTRFS
jgi:regulator of sigma E protease